ncbi:MAG: hypothetical protein K9K67_13850 [Bacteriovoracaceae bacterium]|nr:hypothetical protein [Bacteriovoracaceae bacterium]
MKKRISYLAIFLIVTIGALEFTGFIASRFQSLPKEITTGELYQNDPNLTLLTWVQKFNSHPFFGYIEKGNDLKLERLKIEKTSKQFVILLTGGSLSYMFGSTVQDSFPGHLKSKIPSLQNYEIIFLNLALAAGKQPMQHNILTYLLESVDLVINLDGYNDVSPFPGERVIPLEYPAFWLRFFSKELGNQNYRYAAELSRSIYIYINNLPLRFPILKASHAYYYSWRALRYLLYNSFNRLSKSYLKSCEKLPVSILKEENFLNRRLDIWKKYTELSTVVSKHHGVRYFSFVQPNQYLPNSKVLTTQEIKVAIDSTEKNQQEERMISLQKAASEMKTSGLPVFSLMNIFKKTQNTVYIDGCCHINKYGDSLLEEEIIRIIAKHW